MNLFMACGLFLAFWGKSPEIQVVKVAEAPYSSSTELEIILPETDEILQKDFLYLQLRVEGFVLGTQPDLNRAQELVNSPKGQAIQIVIDEDSSFSFTGPTMSPFDEDENYYQASSKVKIPFSLKKGEHLARAFLIRSFGESLKTEQAFSLRRFFVEERKINQELPSLKEPILTYNQPSPSFPFSEKKPVLLDFYLSNCELSEDGYQVKLTVDNKKSRFLTSWGPYYIYGLSKGSHTVEIELLDQNKKKVGGNFNKIKKRFTVH